MNKILSIDPSGTGTSGICLIDNDQIEFQEICNPFWERHLEGVVNLVKKHEREMVICENFTFLLKRYTGQDRICLIKLIGAIESLKYHLPVEVFGVLVNQVKKLRYQILKGKKVIEPLNFKKGLGWFHGQQKISVHQLDAFLVYYLFACKMAKI